MKINSIQNSYSSFQSRNKNVRRADDLQRNIGRCFPMLSPTYMDIFYNCHKTNASDSSRSLRAEEIVNKIDRRISILRGMFSPKEYETNENSLLGELDAIKRIKIGNCGESATTVVAGLAANGIYDVETASLHLDLKYTDKKTGKCEYSITEPIDHMFVIANINPDSDDDKDKVIIDSWMGFTDSLSGAMDRYKSIFNENHLKEKLKFHRSMFRVDYAEKYSKLVDYNDFNLSTRLIVKTEQTFDKKNLKELGKYCRKKYPGLVID